MSGSRQRAQRAGLALAGIWLCVAPAHAEPPASIALGKAAATRSDAHVTEARFAEDLVDLLGLARLLPEDPEPTEVISLLCPDQAELTLSAGGRSLPENAAFRVAVDTPPRNAPDAPVTSIVRVPVTAIYQLTVEGTGRQRWVIDERPVGHLDPSPLGVSQARALVALERGPHEVSGYLVPGARVDRIELAAYRALCIAPSDGWHPERPLRFGAYARSLVRVFDLDRKLPERGEASFELEAERFDEMSGGGGRTSRRLSMPASGGAWAAAVASPAEFTWQIALEEPAVVSIEARTHGVEAQLWSVDGRYRVSLDPESFDAGFAWNHVITLPLASGRHALRALVPRGAGVDSLRIVARRSSDAAYIALLDELGFEVGAPGAAVARGVWLETLGAAGFVELANGFRLRMDGDLRDRSLIFSDHEPARWTSRPASPLLPAEM